ncbi:transcriptional repressor LexA [candidate division FCPU426 bacterium]|nr:transcriptional repressor LexA [candidate division FCPU426 bacterium]
MALTRKQKEILDYVQGCIRSQGYAPTLREIGEHFGLSSVATVHKHLKTLEEKGMLRREEGRARCLELTECRPAVQALPVPLLGLVAAGSPIEALEQPESMVLPEDMLGRGETFVLRVKGDSMIEDHILDGDHIIVEKRQSAQNGEIIVALIENEATVKRFYREAGRVRLQPANAALRPIYVEEGDLRIQGVVIGVLRRMQRR